jgi:hypothetical protein
MLCYARRLCILYISAYAAMPCYAIHTYYVTLRHVIIHTYIHAMPCHTYMLYTYYAILYIHAMLCRYYVMLCYAMLTVMLYIEAGAPCR